MNSLKNTKTHLDDFFAEARANEHITPAGNLLKSGIAAPQNSFKSNFVKVGFAGMVSVAALSFMFLKEDAEGEKQVVKEKKEIVQSDDFKKEISAVVLKVESQSGKKKNSRKIYIPNKVVEPPIESDIPENAEIISIEPIQLNAIQLIELRDIDLKKLGITVLKDGDMEFRHSPDNDTVHLVHRITDKIISSKKEEESMLTVRSPIRIVSREEHKQIAPPQFTPKKITDVSGTKTYFSSSTESDRVMQTSDLPSEIRDILESTSERTMDSATLKILKKWGDRQARLQDSLEKTQRFIPIKAGNFIAWFRAEDEVLKALPESVCNTIHAELSGQDVVVQAAEFHQEYPTSGYCYLDMCEKMNGAIMCSKVFPNPAVGKQTFLSFELSEERNIGIALYDLSGRKLREFSALKTFEKGKHEEELSLVGIEKGIYLIAIITDRGEKLSRRVIID